MRDLGEFPRSVRHFFVEDPDEIEARVGPVLRAGFFVAQYKVGDVNDGLVFPGEEDDAASGAGIVDELMFFAFGVFEAYAKVERTGQGSNGVFRAQALYMARRSRGKDGGGFGQAGMLELAVQWTKEAD